MMQMIEANWLALLLVLVIALLVAWWIFSRGSGANRERHRSPDALDEGAPPVQRNQALIDSPPAAGFASGPTTFGGVGEVIAVAAQDEVAAAEAQDIPRETIVETGGEADDLRRLKGVGPKLATLLASLGITRFEQIASWSDEDIDRMDAKLGTFAGRIRRDNWVEQAKYLASGDVAGFEARFGKL